MRARVRLLAALMAGVFTPVQGARSQDSDRLGQPTAGDTLRGRTEFHVIVNRVNVPSSISTDSLVDRIESAVEQSGIDTVGSAEIPVIHVGIPLLTDPPDLALDVTAFQAGDGSVVGILRLHVEQSVKLIHGEDDSTLDPEDDEALDDDEDDEVIRAATWQATGHFTSLPTAGDVAVTLNQTADLLVQDFLTDQRAANPPAEQEDQIVIEWIM